MLMTRERSVTNSAHLYLITSPRGLWVILSDQGFFTDSLDKLRAGNLHEKGNNLLLEPFNGSLRETTEDMKEVQSTVNQSKPRESCGRARER